MSPSHRLPEGAAQKALTMFWLVHIHNENSFLGHNFGFSLNMRAHTTTLDGKIFSIMSWAGSNKQFIEKWKRARAHVFFHCGSAIYYLAGKSVVDRMGVVLQKGEFALCQLTCDDFLRAVRWAD